MLIVYCIISACLLFHFTCPYTLGEIYGYYNTQILNNFELIPIVSKDIEYARVEGLPCFKYRYNNFKIWEIYNILNEKECKEIIKISENTGFNDSKVFKPNGPGKRDNYARTSKTCWIDSDNNSLTVQKIYKMSAKLTNIPVENQENIQVAQYDKGGLFIAHYDPCDTTEYSKEICERQNMGAGPRVATLLIYLNDDYTGGQTEFPAIPFLVQPKMGKGILFWSTDNMGNIHDEALHRGLEVLSGKKYICTVWSHIGKYPEISSNHI